MSGVSARLDHPMASMLKDTQPLFMECVVYQSLREICRWPLGRTVISFVRLSILWRSLMSGFDAPLPLPLVGRDATLKRTRRKLLPGQVWSPRLFHTFPPVSALPSHFRHERRDRTS